MVHRLGKWFVPHASQSAVIVTLCRWLWEKASEKASEKAVRWHCATVLVKHVVRDETVTRRRPERLNPGRGWTAARVRCRPPDNRGLVASTAARARPAMDLILVADGEADAVGLAKAADSVETSQDETSSVWSSDSNNSDGDGSENAEEKDEPEEDASSSSEEDDSDSSEDEDDDGGEEDEGVEDDERLANREDPEAEGQDSYGPDGWQVLSRSINTWLAAEIVERSTMEDGTSVLNVRYRLPEGRLRQKWVINDPTEVRRNPELMLLSPREPVPPAEWGSVPMSPRSPLTVMESYDQFQAEPQPEPEPEPEPEAAMDREVALATAMALSAAAAAASGVKGIPPGLKRIPEGIPPSAVRGILLASGDGKAKSKGGKGRLKGLGKKLGGGTRHVQWMENELGSPETACVPLEIAASEIKSRKRHAVWIGEQRRAELQEPTSPRLAGLRGVDSVDLSSRRIRSLQPKREMSDIC